MYKGKRDAHIAIKVPQSLCFEVTNSSGVWIAVYVPPFNVNRPMSEWKAFIVTPDQVYWYDSVYNVIENINNHTRIRCCLHYQDDKGLYKPVPDTDLELDPYEIIQHIEHYVYESSK